MTNIQTQFIYHLFVNNIVPIMANSVSSISSSYFSGRTVQPPTIIRSEIDDERELDLLQMDRFLKWMSLIFDDSIITPTPGHVETQKAYKKELYSIYMTIGSDYKQYKHWKKYNNEIWLFSSYRCKNTKSLANKILSDIKLFNEGLKMFSMFVSAGFSNSTISEKI
jgi:hypothetical protein